MNPTTTALTERIAQVIRQAVYDNDMDDHQLYMMGQLADEHEGRDASLIIAAAVAKELEDG